MSATPLSEVESDAPRAVGRPRSTRAHEAIIEAVLDLLASGVTIDELSIEAVAARAGVGKATIYRRWQGKSELLVDAVIRLKGAPPTPPGVSVREDLVYLLSRAGHKQDERASRVMPCLVPEVVRNADYHRMWQEHLVRPRREVLRSVVRAGIERGELRADLDVEIALLALTGPVLVQRMLQWNPELSDDGLAERVVDMVLEGLKA